MLLLFTLVIMVISANQAGCRAIFDKKNPAIMEERREKQKNFYVGDVANSFGTQHFKVEGVALVTGLAGTGSDPPDNILRKQLLKEMSSQQTHQPQRVLASPNTSLVLMKGFMKPGIRKGERFDIVVTLQEMSETTSLRGGYLLESSLSDVIVTDRLRKGWVRAKAQGPILVAPQTGIAQQDKAMQRRGKVLSGGVCLKDRPVGLLVDPDAVRHNRLYTQYIEKVINRRFQTMGRNGLKEVVAKAKDDKFVELYVPPLYKDNLRRFLDVVRCLPMRESESDQMTRMAHLQIQLHQSPHAARAALELEAIGTPAIDTLRTGLDSDEVAVRFHAAQALAYLDVDESAPVLGKVAADEPDYRYHALLALQALNDIHAEEELRMLMNEPTAETRYGAFRALTAMRPDAPTVRGMKLGDDTFTLCVVNTTAKPMLHVTRAYRAEVVIFGAGMRFSTPLAVEGANNVVVRSISDTEIMVSKFTPNQPDQRRTVSTRIEEVIVALSDVGATYPDVLEILQAAVAQKALPASAFRVDALPDEGRRSPYEKLENTPPKKKNRRAADTVAAVEEPVESAEVAEMVEWAPDGMEEAGE